MEDPAKTLAGLHILVVEDEVMVAMMLEDMVQDLGCRVDLAPTIGKALDSLRKNVPDGVLLDMAFTARSLWRLPKSWSACRSPFCW